MSLPWTSRRLQRKQACRKWAGSGFFLLLGLGKPNPFNGHQIPFLIGIPKATACPCAVSPRAMPLIEGQSWDGLCFSLGFSSRQESEPSDDMLVVLLIEGLARFPSSIFFIYTDVPTSKNTHKVQWITLNFADLKPKWGPGRNASSPPCRRPPPQTPSRAISMNLLNCAVIYIKFLQLPTLDSMIKSNVGMQKTANKIRILSQITL